MKKNYSSPTIFNASNMKLSATSRGNNSLILENPAEGGILPAFVLSGATTIIHGRKDIGQKAFGLPNKKI